MLVTQAGDPVRQQDHVRQHAGTQWASWLTAGRTVTVFAALALTLVAVRPVAALEHWLTSYEAALAAAESTGRPVLTLFTGSDWCPHCKTLEHNVFGSDAFQTWAKDNVVLLMVDLPQAGISQDVRNQRSQICINYGIRTFPTVLLLGPDGRKITAQTGYTGQSASEWLARMQEHMPASQVAAEDAKNGEPSEKTAQVHDSLDAAVVTARGARRPILLVVARPGDTKARSQTESLINDPEFGSFTRENFVVAQVAPPPRTDAASAQPLDHLLGGADLPPESVELIVTDDGQTPLFSQSGAQPPARIVHGLRRFLAARQASRQADHARR